MKSKIALITGGSRGLGKEMALRLAEAGRNIVITYLTKKKEADEVVEQIKSTGQMAVAMQLNVGDIASFDNFVERFSSVLHDNFNNSNFDFLINNAGIGLTKPIKEVTEEDFDRLLNVLFKGVYFFTQKTLPLMNNGGRIINISTGTTRFCIPGYSVYASMKVAIETFTKYLASELGDRKITANVVAPGGIETDFNDGAIKNNPQVKAFLASGTALGRVGQVEDIGGIVAFLCSKDGGWINAQRIEASGGVFI